MDDAQTKRDGIGIALVHCQDCQVYSVWGERPGMVELSARQLS